MHLLTHVLIGFQKTISKYCSTKLSVVLKCHATRNVTITKEDLKRYGIFGWDVGRICFLQYIFSIKHKIDYTQKEQFSPLEPTSIFLQDYSIYHLIGMIIFIQK